MSPVIPTVRGKHYRLPTADSFQSMTLADYSFVKRKHLSGAVGSFRFSLWGGHTKAKCLSHVLATANGGQGAGLKQWQLF